MSSVLVQWTHFGLRRPKNSVFVEGRYKHARIQQHAKLGSRSLYTYTLEIAMYHVIPRADEPVTIGALSIHTYTHTA